MLHSLIIKNFRCLEDFSVEKLGRVNLIVGKNNSGKSTVLEALRIYAGNANESLLEKIAESHDETFHKNSSNFLYKELFTGRELPKNLDNSIFIGESECSSRMKNLYINTTNEGNYVEHITEEEYEIYNSTHNAEWEDMFPSIEQISYAFVPTYFVSINLLANTWDEIVYTEHEKIVIDALKIIIPEFEHLVFVENKRQKSSRIAKVKLSNYSRPVPLKSLGDGMTRILQLALKLVSAQGGFLLIDEFENGLHYSTQEKIWSWLFEVAEQLDIQVFATTHSWDCIESFTKVANEKPNIEGILFRMGRSAKKSNYGQIIATVFDKEALYDLTQIDVEIR